jgi:hypothetical protein
MSAARILPNENFWQDLASHFKKRREEKRREEKRREEKRREEKRREESPPYAT